MCVPLGFLDEARIPDIAALLVKDLHDWTIRLKETGETQKCRERALSAAFRLKFGETAQELLHRKGQDTGTVKFTRDHATITATFCKKVEGDSEYLARLAAEFPDSVKCTYSVDEKTYEAMPEEQKIRFREARTVKRTGYEFRSRRGHNEAEFCDVLRESQENFERSRFISLQENL